MYTSLSTCLSVCMSVCLYVCLSVCLSTCLSARSPLSESNPATDTLDDFLGTVDIPVAVRMGQSLYLSLYQRLYLSVCLPVHLSECLRKCLSLYTLLDCRPFVCPSVTRCIMAK